jgi:hypothetical protein
MKTIFTFIITALVSLTAYGQQAPVFQWGAVLRSNDLTTVSGLNISHNIKTNDAGDIFVFGTFNSHANSAFKYIDYKHYDAGGNLTVKRSPNGALTTTSVSGNPNLVLYKMNKEGEIAWQVTSNRGYVDSHYSQFTPTADGGVLLILCVRMAGSNEFEDNRLIRIVVDNGTSSANGSVVRPNYNAAVNTNTDQGVAVKIAADGQVEWSKCFMRVDDARINGKSATTAIYFNDLVTDAEGNFWLAGRYLKAITFDTPGGDEQTFTPHNVAGWEGDAQELRGDALLVKLNPEGKLLWKLETTGTVDYQAVNSLQYDNGNLFLYGNIAATLNDPASSSTFFGHTLRPSDKTNAWSACIDLSGNEPTARWVTLFKSLKQTNGSGGRIMVSTINCENNALFLCGSFHGFIEVDGNSILANDATGDGTNPLRGFIVRQNPASGEITGAVMDQAIGLAAGIETVAFRQNKIYAFGYALGGSWLHVYDTDFRQTAGYNFLASEGATAWDALFLDDRLITVNRGRNINLFGGGISGAPAAFVSDDPPAYSSFYLSYRLDGLQETGIQDVLFPSEAIGITSRPAAVCITGNASVKIFTPAGILRFSGQVNGEREIPLPAGIYIVAANGTATKIIIKN